MRIDAYNQVAQAYGASNYAKTTGKTLNADGQRDQISISQAGRDYQVAKNAVSEASDIREDKVSRLKERIESGTYSVDAGAFADKLLKKFNTLV